MSDIRVSCPNCGEEFLLEDALSQDIKDNMQEKLKLEYQKTYALKEKEIKERYEREYKASAQIEIENLKLENSLREKEIKKFRRR